MRRRLFVSEVLIGEWLLDYIVQTLQVDIIIVHTCTSGHDMLFVERIMQLTLFDSLLCHRRAERKARVDEIRRKYGE